MRILIAEDDGDFRQLLKAILETWGYEVIAVGDGKEALGVLRGEDAPRLAILDWMMPGMDGVELCRTIRRELPKPYTYLILLTSHQKEEDLIAGMEAGADDYLTKPLDVNELRVRLKAGRRVVELQSQLVETQEKLAARASDLEAANKDLEAFSYAVANDILKSLLAIGDNSKAIQDIYCKELDQQCRNYTHRIYQKTRSLAQLIGVMLEFFRPTRMELNRETLDLTAMVRALCERLRQSDRGRSVRLEIAEGVKGNADPALLQVALHHLLENAWRHTARTREQAVISFGAEKRNGTTVYYVKDNGVGFEAADAEKLFRPFVRLAGTEEFAGRGVGLATVAKIIRRHGGRCWAEGSPGRGASFFFTLV